MMPDARLPISMDARVSKVSRAITSTVPGSSPTPSTLMKAKRLSGQIVTPKVRKFYRVVKVPGTEHGRCVLSPVPDGQAVSRAEDIAA